MLEKMGTFGMKKSKALLNALTSLIEPLLIVVLGVIVAASSSRSSCDL